MPKTTVIIPAAGRGHRFGDNTTPKQYQLWQGRPVLWHTLRRFDDSPEVQSVVVAIHPEDREIFATLAAGFRKLQPPVMGGAERSDSVRAALASLPPATADELVLVHDAVRPWVSMELVHEVIAAAVLHRAVIPALPVTETVKVVAHGVVVDSPTRSRLFNAQTPQGFHRDIIEQAVAAASSGAPATDEASLVERIGIDVHIIPGEIDNVKITTAGDLQSQNMSDLRVGMGYDVHAFAAGRPLILGGVPIAHDRGLAGHSDADVLVHAVIDALLGAARLGDIGRLFPDDDPAYEGIDSLLLLERVGHRLRDGNMGVVNVDAVIMAQVPKLAPHVDAMCAAMAAALSVPAERVSVKATTTERLGFVGREEGMAAQATALLRIPVATLT